MRDYEAEIQAEEIRIAAAKGIIQSATKRIIDLQFLRAGIERGQLVKCAQTGQLFYAETLDLGRWFKGPKQKKDGTRSKHNCTAYKGIVDA